MTKRLVSFDNKKPDLGLPDDVQERMDARYSGIGEAPHIGPNGNWWLGDTDTVTPARGVDGRSVTITGSVATIDDLPQEGSSGEGYITDSDGHLHIWDGSGWVDVGEIRGPQGVRGPQGDPGPAGTTSFLELNDVPPTFPPSNHTHSEYATITQMEARTPEIRTVSSPDQATSPGVLYVVMED